MDPYNRMPAREASVYGRSIREVATHVCQVPPVRFHRRSKERDVRATQSDKTRSSEALSDARATERSIHETLIARCVAKLLHVCEDQFNAPKTRQEARK